MWGAARCGEVTAGETQNAQEVSNAAMSKMLEIFSFTDMICGYRNCRTVFPYSHMDSNCCIPNCQGINIKLIFKLKTVMISMKVTR